MADVPLDERNRRASDRGALCWLAARASDVWDFIDKRDIDKHTVSAFILLGTIRVMRWAMEYATATHPGMTGSDIALVIGAVTGPYSLLQGAAIGFYFNVRK